MPMVVVPWWAYGPASQLDGERGGQQLHLQPLKCTRASTASVAACCSSTSKFAGVPAAFFVEYLLRLLGLFHLHPSYFSDLFSAAFQPRRLAEGPVRGMCTHIR